jgi:AcrR family transcriptional regulator
VSSPTRKPAPRKRAAPSRDAYHHGALREALIEATEALLAERGSEGFSLREVARRSGVSPAAPAHHFGDAEGLLTAVTTLAFDGLTAALQAGNARGGSDPVARLREQGLGYVGFALRYPGRFGLMFRAGAGGVRKDESLERSAHAAFTVLEEGVRLLLGVAPGAPLSPAHWQAILATWSVVHGFAHLALAGQFDHVAQAAMAAAPAGCANAGAATGRAGRESREVHEARETLLRDILSPLLEQQLRGLLATQLPAPKPTSGSR